jgi:AraC family transcriptional regulator, positive regulator of tynA and feaB
MAHAVEVFSTQGIPVLRKAATWNLMLGELIDVQALPRDPMHFDGTLIRQRVGPMTLFEVRCASVRLRHGRARGQRGGRPSFQLLMPVQGEFTLAHADQPTATVGTGSFCLIDRTEPYELTHGDGLRTIGLELPHSLLEACLPKASGYAGVVVRPDSGAGRVLAGLLHALGSELNSEETSGTLPSMVARSIAGFVAAAFVDRSRLPILRGTRARLSAFHEFVEAHLADGDFRPQDLARAFKVSERYVRLVFQEAGETLSSYLLRKRLERAAQLLRNEHNSSHTITDIALECGFNSASHFGHSFRQRYGKTPRDFRAGGRLQRHTT